MPSPVAKRTNYVFNPLLGPPIAFIQIITFGNHNEFTRDLLGLRESPFSSVSIKLATGNLQKAFVTCESWCLRLLQSQSCTPASSQSWLAQALTEAEGVNDSHLLTYFYMLES